ncbi:hypothetical protein CCUS01_14794, partial [Colletotrichum cuscutae]
TTYLVWIERCGFKRVSRQYIVFEWVGVPIRGLWDQERNDSFVVGKASAVGPSQQYEGAWNENTESELPNDF